MTFSRPFCEWSGRKEEVLAAGAEPRVEPRCARELVDDALEFARALLTKELGFGEPSNGAPVLPAAKFNLDVDVFLTRKVLDVGLGESSSSPSSHFRLERVATELEETLRARRRDEMILRSSFVDDDGCKDSLGWSRADVKASRTGNGVRFRTWIDVICRSRR
jgi:hypothetical protein